MVRPENLISNDEYEENVRNKLQLSFSSSFGVNEISIRGGSPRTTECGIFNQPDFVPGTLINRALDDTIRSLAVLSDMSLGQGMIGSRVFCKLWSPFFIEPREELSKIDTFHEYSCGCVLISINNLCSIPIRFCSPVIEHSIKGATYEDYLRLNKFSVIIAELRILDPL